MNCNYVQERLSAFLDREESTDEIEKVFSHLYDCEECQRFFNAAVKLRSLASEDKELYPLDLDEFVLSRAREKRKVNLLKYRLRIPAYVVSAAALVLIIVSFMFGFFLQEGVHQKEMNAILQGPPSQVVYAMPTQWVYPVVNHQSKGDMR